MDKKLIRKMLTASGGPLRIRFTPEQIALFESQSTRIPGMNNSGRNRYRKEGILALQYQEQEAKRKEEERLSRMEMRLTLKRRATTAEKLQGKKDEYELRPLVVGMSGADPVGEFILAGIGLNGIGALAKTGLWNVVKYAPTTQLGNWGRRYFVGNAFKNSFNGAVPTVTSQATSLLYLPVKLNESGLTSLKFFERRPSRLTEAERAGVPKGERNVKQGYLLKDAIEEANKFAEKWGYDKLSQNATLLDIENLYNQHNTFFRGVTTEQLENTRNRIAKELGINPEQLTNDLYLLYASTHPWPGNDRIWVTPFSHYGKIYGNADMIGGKGLLSAVMRPWKTTKDIKQWPKLSLWTLGFKEDISNPVITPWVSNAPDAIRSLGALSELLVKPPLIYRGLGKDFKGTFLLYLKYNDNQGKLGWIESLVGELPLEIIIKKQGGKMNQFKSGGQVRKMLTASGGPIHYSRTMTTDNLSKAANYVGNYILKGLGAFGKIMTAPFVQLGPTSSTIYKSKKLLAKEKAIELKSEELLGKAMTWVSPLNYGAALATGNGLDARKGEEEVASWSPAWLAVGRVGELYVGPKAVKGASRVAINTAARAGVKPAKAAVIAREINKGVNKNTPKYDNRIHSIRVDNLIYNYSSNPLLEFVNTIKTSPTNSYFMRAPSKIDITKLHNGRFRHEVVGNNILSSGEVDGKFVSYGEPWKEFGFGEGSALYEFPIGPKRGPNMMATDWKGRNKDYSVNEAYDYMKLEELLREDLRLLNKQMGELFDKNYATIRNNLIEAKYPLLKLHIDTSIYGGNQTVIPNLKWNFNNFLNSPFYKYTIDPISNQVQKELVISGVPNKSVEPSTSLAFFERKPSKISEAEKFGLNKHDRKALSENELLALEDLALYKNSGLYRLVFRVTPDWENFGWNLDRSNPSFLLLFVKDGESMRGPWARVVLQTPTGKGVLAVNPEKNMAGYTSRSFPVPEGMNWAPGEANMMIDGTNGLKIILTAPRTDFFDAIVEKGSESIGEKLPNTIDKSIMKDFWINSKKVLRPGTYLSGDNGHAPKGSELIEAFKKRQLHKVDIKERPLNKLFVTRTGLSPDSYSSIIRQGNRDGSLRWGEGFNKWNNSAVENRFINEAFLKLQKGEITPEQYEEIFNNWSLNIGGRPLQWTTIGELKIPVHPHPYIYAKKQGGKMNILEFLKNGSGIHIKEKNKGKFTSYCGGKVTDECILKGKNSSNPAIRKRATFALNARHFKHRSGGLFPSLKVKKHLAFVPGASITDSNPKAYKYLKKHKYSSGGFLKDVGDFLKSNSGMLDLGKSLFSGISDYKQTSSLLDGYLNKIAANANLQYEQALMDAEIERQKTPDIFTNTTGEVINQGVETIANGWLPFSLKVSAAKRKLDLLNAAVDLLIRDVKGQALGNMFGTFVLNGLGTLTSILG